MKPGWGVLSPSAPHPIGLNFQKGLLGSSHPALGSSLRTFWALCSPASTHWSGLLLPLQEPELLLVPVQLRALSAHGPPPPDASWSSAHLSSRRSPVGHVSPRWVPTSWACGS